MNTTHTVNDWIAIQPQDDVIIALRDYVKGESITLPDSSTFTLRDDVPKGHKIAVHTLAPGEDVMKYGFSIGIAKEQIEQGSWIHSHNLKTGLHGLLEYQYQPAPPVQTDMPPEHLRSFDGYLRPNGEAGIRNEIWIVNTVGCINKVCEALARMGQSQFGSRVDGVYHFPHPFGCSQLGDDLKYTQQVLASLVEHPNAGGVLVIGLGCENNQVDQFRECIAPEYQGKVRFLKAQETDDELEEGLRLMEELVELVEHEERQPLPLSKLKIGLKCGGSDGLSGITANPLVGSVADMLVAAGGTAILTEVPEMFGAETILMNRAASEQVFDDLVDLVNGFKQYFVNHGQNIYENPSPGNKAGGITTLEEKSLGCTQKGGRSAVVDVLRYGKRVTSTGLNIVEAPGNDLVSVTALSAAGAHIVLFTTGRGTPFGGPVPTVKIATQSDLANRKKHWIDFNAGQLLEGKTMEDVKVQLFSQLIDIASGRGHTLSEQHGFREIAIFKDGVIL
ncbi:altronate dehydratase family protein [Paenibacillus sp. F6_3S_P_1C]|uniref:Altronate dehydratase family protein n=1 Tax=Paenibacillus vandeheii TaxID=3035917 RepID=A0ABT8J7I5_9BACL|nr:altronate dehydratase family protein [Paenibacillus vandeheii]MDN4601043.1 altronate dehydratase family protein [Paenibacillus vandeheii]